MGLEKINIFKKEQGLTNEDLAKLSGVPKSTIDKITSGKTYDPKLETVRAIAKALGKTINDFDDEITDPNYAKELDNKEVEKLDNNEENTPNIFYLSKDNDDEIQKYPKEAIKEIESFFDYINYKYNIKD